MTITRISFLSVALLILLTMTSCIKEENKLSSPKENFSLELPAITAVVLDFPATVRIKQGAVQQITINAQVEIFDALTKEVNGGVWWIDLKGAYRFKGVTIDITLPQLSELKTTSTGDILVEDSFNNLNQLLISTTSTGDIHFNGEAPSMLVEMDGTGDIYLAGRTKELQATINGLGDLNTYELQTEDATITANSLGNAEVQVQRTLDATITDLGDIYYKGTPIINSTISGNGDLIDAN